MTILLIVALRVSNISKVGVEEVAALANFFESVLLVDAMRSAQLNFAKAR